VIIHVYNAPDLQIINAQVAIPLKIESLSQVNASVLMDIIIAISSLAFLAISNAQLVKAQIKMIVYLVQ
jgi:hypothetical protein